MDFKEANVWCANQGVSLERGGDDERVIILRLGELVEQAQVHEESWNAWKHALCWPSQFSTAGV